TEGPRKVVADGAGVARNGSALAVEPTTLIRAVLVDAHPRNRGRAAGDKDAAALAVRSVPHERPAVHRERPLVEDPSAKEGVVEEDLRGVLDRAATALVGDAAAVVAAAVVVDGAAATEEQRAIAVVGERASGVAR